MAVAISELSRWARLGIVAGFLACIIYPLLILAPLPDKVGVTLAALWGPMLMIASMALYHVLMSHRRTIAAKIAVVSNALAAAMVTAMFLVQIATNRTWSEKLTQFNGDTAEPVIRAAGAITWMVQLGLDVVWDVFISLGTFLFGLAMLSHPRFGKVLGFSGMVVGAALFALNIWTFPTPPGSADLVDLGPAVGLWYLAVTICMVFSLKWIDRSESSQAMQETLRSSAPHP